MAPDLYILLIRLRDIPLIIFFYFYHYFYYHYFYYRCFL